MKLSSTSAQKSTPVRAVRTSPEAVTQSAAIETVPLHELKPAKINDTVYKPVALDDPAIVKLAKSVKDKGLLQPLDVTTDNVIVSGHRRRAACLVAKLEAVPIRRLSISSTDPRFASYLVDFNEQRVKSVQESIREEVVRTSPEAAHLALLANRRTETQKSLKKAQDAQLRVLHSGAATERSVISDAKQAMLDAAVGVIDQYADYWPLTLRQIHYRLLSRNVLRNTKSKLKYSNNQESYKDLSDMLGRARLAGLVDWSSMHDPTRPHTSWQHWENAGEYVREQLDEFLTGYRRNRLQSQPAYIELVVEKITVQEIAERAAGHYHVPVGVGRGYASISSLEETAARYLNSGKGHFILLIASDLDPEGEDICGTWQAHLRDEHGVENLTVVKVGVNPDQVSRYNLAPLPMKEESSRAIGYAAVHGTSVYELESFEPDVLQSIIRDAIRGVLDLDLFAEEERREAEDARFLIATRNQVCGLLKGFRMSPDDENNEGGDE